MQTEERTSPVTLPNVHLANIFQMKLRHHDLLAKLGVTHRGVELLIVDGSPDKAVGGAEIGWTLVIDCKKLSGGQLKAFHGIDRATNYVPGLSSIGRVVAHLMAM